MAILEEEVREEMAARKRGELGLRALLSSRDGATFAVGGAQLVRGGRLHWALNSLSLDFISGTLALLGEGGAFGEIGKRGVWSEERQAAARSGTLACRTIAYDVDTLFAAAWLNGVLSLCARPAAFR